MRRLTTRFLAGILASVVLLVSGGETAYARGVQERVRPSAPAVSQDRVPEEGTSGEAQEQDVSPARPETKQPAGGADVMAGTVEVLITAGVPVEKPQEFQVELRGAVSGSDNKKAVLEPAAEGTLRAPQASARFSGLEAGAYELRVSGGGYVAYTQSLAVDGLAYRIQLYTGEAAVGTDAARPGLLSRGDLNGDGKLDGGDTELLVNAIDAGQYREDCDLYGDGVLDLRDLNYLTRTMGNSVQATPELGIPLEAAGFQVSSGSIRSGTQEQFLRGESGLLLAPSGGAAELEFDFSRYQKAPVMEEIRIGAPQKKEYAVTEGVVVIETADGGVAAASIRSGAFLSPAAAKEERFDIVPGKDGSVRIDLKGQIAVKKVTIRITKTGNADNLAEISSVEFVNDMESRIPEPEMNVPKNVAVKASSKAFTVSWDVQNNVTAYELQIVSEGKTDYRRTSSANMSIQQFLGDKLQNNVLYEVRVQSLNGEWKSGYSESVPAVPKPNGKPPAPDAVKVTGGYRSLDARWKKMEDTDSYNLYYKEDGTEKFEKIAGIEGTYHQITGLKDSTRYQVYVTGTNELGEGPASLTASDKTISGLIPAKLPEYKLINTSKGEGKLSAHIASAVIGGGNVAMVDSPLDREENSALGAFDNNYNSYIDRQDWDYGGAYPGDGKGVTVELDQAFEIGMITLAQPMDVGDFAYAHIRYQDGNGKWQIVKDASISRKRSGERNYYLIKWKEPVKTSRLQIGVGQRYGYYKVAVSEIRIHEYDSLEREILDLFADDLFLTLRDGVDQAVIDGLQARLDRPDPVSGEYHPERNALQEELDAAKALLATEGLGGVVEVNPEITAQKDRGIAVGGLVARQPLGVSAAAGEQLVVYVGNPGMKSGEKTKLELVFTQQYAESGGLSQKVLLKVGRNEITVPRFSSTDVEKGGPLYVQYTGGDSRDRYAVRVSGGTAFPVLNVYRADASERTERIRAYVQELGDYVKGLSDSHSRNHASGEEEEVKGYAYSDRTCILNATDIVTDYMMLSVPASQVLAGLGEGGAGKLADSLEAMDEMMLLFYQHKGLTDSFAADTPDGIREKNHLPCQYLNIRYMRMFAGAFMYAAGDHIGIEWGSVPGLTGGVPVRSDDKGRYESGRYFGWGIAHEIGHQINQSAYAHAEVTNNYFSVLAQAKDTNESVRFQYPEVFKKVTSGTTGYAGNVFTQLGMYWQLHLAYDRGYNYKTYGTWQEIQDGLFFARVDRYARDTSSAPAPGGVKLELSGGRDQNLMRLASAAAGRDLSEFFAGWGMVPDSVTRSYMGQFEREERAVFYVDDAARVYEMTHGYQQGVAGKTAVASAEASADNTGRVTLAITPSAAPEMLQGYEITRIFTEWGEERREVAGFTRDTSFTDQAAYAANHVVTYEIRAVDKWMNRSEAYRAVPVKVRGSGRIDKDGWTVTTNMVSKDDVIPDATEELPCEKTAQSAIGRAVDGDYSTTYTGTASGEDPYILLAFNCMKEVSALNYTCDKDTPAGAFRIEISRDGETFEAVQEGTFVLGDQSARIHFTDENHRICTYDAAYVKLTAVGQKGKEISVTELDLYAPSGDNVEFSPQGIGRLAADYAYAGEDGNHVIPKDSIVFTGTYKGNPAYNVVVLYDEKGGIVGGTDSEGTLSAHQIILAPPLKDEEAMLGNVSEGIWIYWFEPAESVKEASLPERVRAELYRVDNALTNEGQRLVSDTVFVKVPDRLSSVTFE